MNKKEFFELMPVGSAQITNLLLEERELLS